MNKSGPGLGLLTASGKKKKNSLSLIGTVLGSKKRDSMSKCSQHTVVAFYHTEILETVGLVDLFRTIS